MSECSKLAQKENKTRQDWVGKVINWEICKKFKFEQMIYAQPSICPGEWDAPTPMGFWDTNGSLNLSETTRPYDNQQKKENL